MSEEKHNLQHKADRAKPGSKRSVLSYMTILFVAAFVLLLLAYFMQQRSSEAAIDGLKDSVHAIQSAQEVYEENSMLKEEISNLEEQISQLNDQIKLQQNNSDQQEKTIQSIQQQVLDLERSTQALDWFWQINEAYVCNRYSLARELIEKLQSAELTDYLPKESITNNGRFSPYDRYQEIYEALY